MRHSTILSLCLIALCSAGCGSGTPKGRLPVYKVTGLVTYKGKPLPDADITFFNAEANRSAFGRTNSEGQYELTTYAPRDGALEGTHKVTVTKIPPVPPTPTPAPVDSPDYVPPTANQSTDPPRPKSEVPEKYGKADESGLTATVVKDGDNKIDLPLE